MSCSAAQLCVLNQLHSQNNKKTTHKDTTASNSKRRYKKTREDKKLNATKMAEGRQIEELKYSDASTSPNSKSLQQLESDLIQQLGELQLEESPSDTPVFSIDQVRKLSKDWYERKLKEQKNINFSKLTQGSQEWLDARSYRFTASEFSTGMTMFGLDRFNEFFYSKVGVEEPFAGNEATQYGSLNEANALEQYKQITGFNVDTMGMVVDTQGEDCTWIGGSPDGLIHGFQNDNGEYEYQDEAISKGRQMLKQGKPGLLEIKCPYKLRSGNSKPLFQRQYMLQIQALLQLLGYEWAHLYVWSPKNTKIFYVERHDIQWKRIVQQLKRIWFDHIVPAMWSWEMKKNKQAIIPFEMTDEQLKKSWNIGWFSSWYQIEEDIVYGDIIVNNISNCST